MTQSSPQAASSVVAPFSRLSATAMDSPAPVHGKNDRNFRPTAVIALCRLPAALRVTPASGKGNPTLVYFAGCYAAHIRPEIGDAAVKVLEAAGFRVIIPPQHCLPHADGILWRQARIPSSGNLANMGSHTTTIPVTPILMALRLATPFQILYG